MHSTEIPPKVLSIRRGEELKVHILDDLDQESSFMNGAYRQALRAVAGIVQRTHKYHNSQKESRRKCSKTKKEKNEESLLTFGSNVIAFSAQRGGGKTSTMLSFARMLEKNSQKVLENPDHRFLSEEARNALASAQFCVLSPVSPSVLEEQQNILYVVLARLYNYALELMQVLEYRGRDEYCSESNHTDTRNKLKRELQACFDGIKGVKQATKDIPGDIMELQEICDGLSLCKHFSMLVQEMVKCLGGENHYLILQLDDADSQVKNGFGVLEDVRKYLQIPNLIILISVDIELVHDSVRQDFQSCFPDRKDDPSFLNRLIRMCRKYIDKLIPPTHLISLPQLDAKVDQYADNLQLHYFDADDASVFPEEEEDFSLQEKLLMLIYRKTGIVFVKPSGHPHSIIPTTLRGLNQLLCMLIEMEDIPLIQDESCFQESKKFVEAFRKQIAVQEYNLAQFADYFSNDWIYVKVPTKTDLDFLRILRDANGERYVSIVIDYLYEKYNLDKEKGYGMKVYNSVYLDSLMYRLQDRKSTQADHYFLFAIRTLFTLKHHKMILAQKSAALAQIAQEENTIYAVDYDVEKLHLSKSYLVNPQILNITLGVSQSYQEVLEKRQLRQEKTQLQKKKEQLQNEWENEKEQLQGAQQARLDAEKSLQEAEQEYRIAEAELKAVESTLTTKPTAQSEYQSVKTEPDALELTLTTKTPAQAQKILLNTRKAHARTKIIYEEAIKRIQDARNAEMHALESVQRAEKRYSACTQEMERNHIGENLDSDDDKLLSICGADEDTAFYDSVQVRPAFPVTNALNNAWAAQEKSDEVRLLPAQLDAKRFLHSCMIAQDEHGYKSVSFLNSITCLLRLGAKEWSISPEEDELEEVRKNAYYAQECALTIAANWEIQDQIYHKMRINLDDARKSYMSADDGIAWLSVLFSEIDKILQHKINPNSKGDSIIYTRVRKNVGTEMTYKGIPLGTYWSISNGFSFLTDSNYTEYRSFESALREIFDLPSRKRIGPLREEDVIQDNLELERNPKRPDDMDDTE